MKTKKTKRVKHLGDEYHIEYTGKKIIKKTMRSTFVKKVTEMDRSEKYKRVYNVYEEEPNTYYLSAENHIWEGRDYLNIYTTHYVKIT